MSAIGEIIGFLSLFSAIVIGTFVGSIRDPYQIIFLLMLVMLASRIRKFRYLLILVVAFILLRSGYTYHRFTRGGLGASPLMALSMLAHATIISTIAAASRFIASRFQR